MTADVVELKQGGHKDSEVSVACSANHVVTSGGPMLIVWDCNGVELASRRGTYSKTLLAKENKADNSLVIISDQVYRFDLASREFDVLAPLPKIHHFHASQDGQYIVMANETTRNIVLYSLALQKELWTKKGLSNRSFLFVAVSDDGGLVWIGEETNLLCFDMRSKEQVFSIACGKPLLNMILSPDG